MDTLEKKIDINAFSITRNVQYSKPTKEKVCSFFQKFNKNIDICMLERVLEILVNKQIIEVRGENGQESLLRI